MSPWSGLRRYLAAAAACAALGVLSFGRNADVPLLWWVDLGIHEAGHVATLWLPEIATAMAGSAAQVLVPLALAAYFALAQGEVPGAALCAAWAGTSARNASVYIADAPAESLSLVGGGQHDWSFALGPEGLDAMDRAGAIAGTVRGAGLALVIVAVAACLAAPVLARRGAGHRWGPAQKGGVSSSWPPGG